MNSQRENGNNKLCEVCQKEFSSVSAKNRHLKDFHHMIPENSRHQHIQCPLCSEEQRDSFGHYESLIKHLEQYHNVSIKESVLYFRNLVEFETWRGLENREVDYVCRQKNKRPDGKEYIYYNCNRSNCRGFVSSCEKRSMKCGGSIHISGVCPSRITVEVSEDGLVLVKFVETHIRHTNELRAKRLSKVEQENIVGQLAAGVTNDRVLQDARTIRNGKLERINLITRGDLAYLIRKFNIDKQRDAVAMFEQISDSVSDNVEDSDPDALHIEEPTTSQTNYHRELSHYIEENKGGGNFNQNFEERPEIVLAEFCNYVRTLDEESFEEFLDGMRKLKNMQQRNIDRCRKRKIEKQLYYPNKK